jgi:hypothetical protein
VWNARFWLKKGDAALGVSRGRVKRAQIWARKQIFTSRFASSIQSEEFLQKCQSRTAKIPRSFWEASKIRLSCVQERGDIAEGEKKFLFLAMGVDVVFGRRR